MLAKSLDGVASSDTRPIGNSIQEENAREIFSARACWSHTITLGRSFEYHLPEDETFVVEIAVWPIIPFNVNVKTSASKLGCFQPQHGVTVAEQRDGLQATWHTRRGAQTRRSIIPADAQDLGRQTTTVDTSIPGPDDPREERLNSRVVGPDRQTCGSGANSPGDGPFSGCHKAEQRRHSGWAIIQRNGIDG